METHCVKIVKYPHPCLRRISKPLGRVDSKLRALVAEMLELMYELPEKTRTGKYVVTEAVVRGESCLFTSKPKRRKESA